MAEKTPPVTITDSAVQRVKELIANQGNEKLMLRVSVSGGGCSGFQYGFEFAKEAEEGDIHIEKDGVTVLVDDMSLLYLAGSQIDFVNDLVGAAFKISNPNAQSSCGCGTSFSI